MTQVSEAMTAAPGAERSTPRSWGVMSVVCVPLRLALGGLFLLAAGNKLFIENGPQLFSTSIEAFKLFDPEKQGRLIQLGTFVTPWVELLAGIAVVIGLFARAGALVLSGLLVFFIGLIGSALARGLNVKCGCFGNFSPFCPEKLGWCNIWQDVLMLGAAAVIIGTRKHVLAVEQLISGPRA